MQGFTIGCELTNLRAAAETIREHESVRVAAADRWKQLVLGAGDGHAVVASLETEVARQFAATGVQHVRIHTGVVEQFSFVRLARHRVLVAVLLHDRRPAMMRWTPVGCLGAQ